MGTQPNGNAIQNGSGDFKQRQNEKPSTYKYQWERIPEHVGIGGHRHYVQLRTVIVLLGLATVGEILFYNLVVDLAVKTRAAALSLVFPGAGYVASANVAGGILFVLTWALMPLALFAWFGAGALAIPLAVWTLSIPGAYLVTGDTVWQPAGKWTIGALLTAFLYANLSSAAARRRGFKQRKARNEMMESSLSTMEARSVMPQRGDRELDYETLKHLQHLFDVAFQADDDWSWYNIIDQFQTSALRYQLYEMMYTLGVYQGVYAPNAHGYVSEAFRRLIEKSLTPKVLGYWKWESMLGNFTTDFDPIKKDNIMVSGWLLEGLMLYTANTRDERYCKPGSLRFRVSEDLVYDYDIHSIRAVVVRQWREDPYCLFPCEPNWVYTPCNFQAMTGASLYDRYFGTGDSSVILPAFEESLSRNYTEPNGSILPIRSALTGFTIPGLSGALSDLCNVMLGRAAIPHLSRRFWAICLSDYVRFDRATGDLDLAGLAGVDRIDPGNYKPSHCFAYVHVAQSAAEYGDEKLRGAALRKIYDNMGRIKTPTGATCLDPSKSSAMVNALTLRAEMLRGGDWLHLFEKGPSETTLAGPIISSAPYPGVLIAKAFSHDSADLDMVFYPSNNSGKFSITVSRLRPGQTYTALGETVTADKQGEAVLTVFVDGRTPVHLKPVDG